MTDRQKIIKAFSCDSLLVLQNKETFYPIEYVDYFL